MKKSRKFKCRNGSILEGPLEENAVFRVVSSTNDRYAGAGKTITLALPGKKFAKGGAHGKEWDIVKEIK